MNYIHETLSHGDNLEIGHFCVIEEDVVVGDNVKIGNFVLLKKGTVIGNNVFIDSYVRSSGDNFIGNNVTLRFGCTIAREVQVMDGVFISPNVMTIYSNAEREGLGGAKIGENSFIGTAAVIGPSLEIGANSIVGAMAYVNKNVPENVVVVGNPAKIIKTREP